MVVMQADYRPSPSGGWIAAVAPEGTGPPREAHFPNAHEAYHGVLDLIDTLEEESGIPFAALHTLGGDTHCRGSGSPSNRASSTAPARSHSLPP
jgi:hypothetical protein